MKVAFFVGTFPSLSETFILNQITGLLSRGHEVNIFAHRGGDLSRVHRDVISFSLLDRECSRVPSNKLVRVIKGLFLFLTNFHKNPLVFLRCLDVFKYGRAAVSLQLLYQTVALMRYGSDYDIVHCHYGPNGVKGAALRDIGAIRGKLVTTFYGYDVSQYPLRHGADVYTSLFNKGESFLAISEFMKQQLCGFGCPVNKVKLHHLGIDCGKFAYCAHKGKKAEKVRILTIARLVEKKGIEYGIQAVSRIVKKHRNVEYVIIGDGPLRSRCEGLIRDLQANFSIHLAGWKVQEEIQREISSSDILLCPSITAKNGDQEGTPVVILEAMAAGLPVVSTRHSGIPEYVRDGVSGFLTPEKDVDAMADRLDYLIEHPEIWAEIGRRGRVRVEADYDINKLNDELIGIYRGIAENNIVSPLEKAGIMN